MKPAFLPWNARLAPVVPADTTVSGGRKQPVGDDLGHTAPMTPSLPARAMLYMLVAVALFALMDAGLKLLSPHYPALQVAMLRGASALPLVLAWALIGTDPGSLVRVH